ncbi:MAG: RnfH family protein [Aquabacterium sp.]
MALVDASRIRVEIVVSVAPRTVQRVMVELAHGASLRDAVEASGLMGQIEGLDAAGLAAGVWSAGVWGRKERAGQMLRDGDRVELVRQLKVDPKAARRLRYRSQGEKIPKGRHRPADWTATGEGS